jgi:hypothetical protein
MESPKLAISTVVILLLVVGQVPFSMGEWVAVGQAPEERGIYDVIIQATYDGVMDTFPLQLNVVALNCSTEGLEVKPVYPFDRENPIELKYEIELNDSKDFIMADNNLSIYFTAGDTLLKSEEETLVWDENKSYWKTTVEVPFKGEYEAIISVIVDKDSEYYCGNFLSRFNSDEVSENLDISAMVEPRVLTPSESFDARLEAVFGEDPLTELEIFNANLYGTIKDLPWDSPKYLYEESFTAPNKEGIYPISFYAEGQNIVEQKKIYVAEIAKSKSGTCPIANADASGSCSDMKDVRKCVSDYKSDILQISEDELVRCFEDGSGGVMMGTVICEEEFRGDLDGDEELDESDLEILQNVILPLTQTQRQKYVECADYDLDGDVDEQDLECLTNVVSGKWSGGFSGGICFNYTRNTPLKCDLNGDNFVDETDEQVLDELISLAREDIEMPEEILETCDFDEDDQITREDGYCLDYFKGMDLDDEETLLASGQTISPSCMKIYDLDSCVGIRGDINGDYVIDEVDEILIMLIKQGQITGYSMNCADVNKDDRITDEDIHCILSYTAGDKDNYFACLDCDEDTPSEYLYEMEICDDGWDNNCDGLIDRTSTGGTDKCECTSSTPCGMPKDSDGGTSPGIGDGEYQICRKIVGADDSSSSSATGESSSSGYRWYNPEDLECNSARACATLTCNDKAWQCSTEGTYTSYESSATSSSSDMTWEWMDIIDGSLPEETDDPDSSPRTCEDGADNDCEDGDLECEEEEEDSNFWTGAAAGFVVGWFFPQASLFLTLGSALGSSFICDEGDSGCSSFMGGFALGSAVGGLAGKGLKGTEWGDKLGAGAGEDAVGGWFDGSGTTGAEGAAGDAAGAEAGGNPPPKDMSKPTGGNGAGSNSGSGE